jgi:hypothetical protein
LKSIGGQVSVPAAAVIPAPIVYINVAAVKKLVVEFLSPTLSSGKEKVASAPDGSTALL